MNVKIADLKNNLSRHLAYLKQTGEIIIVCDRNHPVAVLSPLQSKDEDSEWKRYRAEALARAQQAGMDINIPVQKPMKSERPRVSPLLAPDGRKDISTIDLVRKGKNY